MSEGRGGEISPARGVQRKQEPHFGCGEQEPHFGCGEQWCECVMMIDDGDDDDDGDDYDECDDE